jgi:hypothetical protein
MDIVLLPDFWMTIVLDLSYMWHLVWQNTWNKQLKKEEKLFCLTVSEVSVHGHVLCWFWACGETEHHGRKQVLEPSCSPPSSKESEMGAYSGSKTKWTLQSVLPLPYCLCLGHYSWSFCHLLMLPHALVTKTLSHSLWGHFTSKP